MVSRPIGLKQRIALRIYDKNGTLVLGSQTNVRHFTNIHDIHRGNRAVGTSMPTFYVHLR